MSIQNNFPAIKPTLLLDFANTKQLDSRITFTRASTATYYGTQTAKAEENLLLQSQEFNVVPWNVIAGVSITANSTTAPDGTSTADTLIGNGTSSIKRVSQVVTPNGTCVLSCFVKKNTNDFVQFYFSGDSTSFANFNVSTGAVGTTGGTVTASIVDVGNGWYRCIAVNTSTAVTTVAINLIDSSSASRAQTTTLSTSVYLWGAQVEQRSAVTAYTPTTTQAITNYIPQLLTAASGVARFDHNPTTFESLGLEIEEQRTNLLTYSEQFDNAAWTKTNSSITANTIVAPDGALTGDALIENTATAEHVLIQTATTASNAARSFSVYAKAAGRSVIRLLFDRDAGFTDYCLAIFDLASGTVVSASNAGTGSGAAGTIVAVGNGWYRCTLTGTPSTTVGTTLRNIVYLQATSGGGTNYTGNGYSGVYIWGAQLEAGAFPTSYIPTVASQVTRAADAASMTGTNFSSWYNQAEGTFYGEFVPVVAASQTMFTVSDNTSNNRILAGYTTNMLNASERVVVGGADQANYFSSFSGQLQVGQLAKLSTVYKTNDFALSLNNGTVATDTSGSIPAVDRLYIVASFNGAVNNMYLKKLAYYPLRVTNAQLQSLTS